MSVACCVHDSALGPHLPAGRSTCTLFARLLSGGFGSGLLLLKSDDIVAILEPLAHPTILLCPSLLTFQVEALGVGYFCLCSRTFHPGTTRPPHNPPLLPSVCHCGQEKRSIRRKCTRRIVQLVPPTPHIAHVACKIVYAACTIRYNRQHVNYNLTACNLHRITSKTYSSNMHLARRCLI